MNFSIFGNLTVNIQAFNLNNCDVAANLAHAAHRHEPEQHVNPGPPRRNGRPENQHPAARPGRDRLPSFNENPAFWNKIFTVPEELLPLLLPDCNLRARKTTRRLLRAVILHFKPNLFIAQRTTKAKYIRLFNRHVAKTYGAFYDI